MTDGSGELVFPGLQAGDRSGHDMVFTALLRQARHTADCCPSGWGFAAMLDERLVHRPATDVQNGRWGKRHWLTIWVLRPSRPMLEPTCFTNGGILMQQSVPTSWFNGNKQAAIPSWMLTLPEPASRWSGHSAGSDEVPIGSGDDPRERKFQYSSSRNSPVTGLGSFSTPILRQFSATGSDPFQFVSGNGLPTVQD